MLLLIREFLLKKNTIFPLNSTKKMEVFFPRKLTTGVVLKAFRKKELKIIDRPVVTCGFLRLVKPMRKMDFAERFSCTYSTVPVVCCPLWTTLLQDKGFSFTSENYLTPLDCPQIQVIKVST